jgi:tRNA pseudouridine38-40 synthase
MAGGAILVTLTYDGTDFAGWQRQPGQRTVQGVLEDAIAAMDGARPDKARAASRTDSGVHAEGQPVAFDPVREIPPDGWVQGLNRHLPDDVAVRAAEPKPRGYDPRFDATGKHYRYLILTSDARDPLLRNRTWHVGRRLDVAAMARAGAVLEGEHDFAAFKAANDERENTVRRLDRVEVVPGWGGRDDVIAIDVEGNAFLKNMVRIIAGTLYEAGRGRMDVESVRALVALGAGRASAGPTAPPEGLVLVSVSLGRLRPGEDR